jgi:hypothetical protein
MPLRYINVNESRVKPVDLNMVDTILSRRQQRYDTAVAAQEAALQEALSRGYVDEAAREEYLNKARQSFNTIGSKYRGDLSRGYEDVQKAITSVRTDPYLKANEAQLEAAKLEQQRLNQLGQFAYINEGESIFDQSLVDEQGNYRTKFQPKVYDIREFDLIGQQAGSAVAQSKMSGIISDPNLPGIKLQQYGYANTEQSSKFIQSKEGQDYITSLMNQQGLDPNNPTFRRRVEQSFINSSIGKLQQFDDKSYTKPIEWMRENREQQELKMREFEFNKKYELDLLELQMKEELAKAKNDVDRENIRARYAGKKSSSGTSQNNQTNSATLDLLTGKNMAESKNKQQTEFSKDKITIANNLKTLKNFNTTEQTTQYIGSSGTVQSRTEKNPKKLNEEYFNIANETVTNLKSLAEKSGIKLSKETTDAIKKYEEYKGYIVANKPTYLNQKDKSDYVYNKAIESLVTGNPTTDKTKVPGITIADLNKVLEKEYENIEAIESTMKPYVSNKVVSVTARLPKDVSKTFVGKHSDIKDNSNVDIDVANEKLIVFNEGESKPAEINFNDLNNTFSMEQQLFVDDYKNLINDIQSIKPSTVQGEESIGVKTMELEDGRIYSIDYTKPKKSLQTGTVLPTVYEYIPVESNGQRVYDTEGKPVINHVEVSIEELNKRLATLLTDSTPREINIKSESR